MLPSVYDPTGAPTAQARVDRSSEMLSPEIRFAEACCKVTADRQREGIGTLGEKTLHAVLKYYYEPDPQYHEQKIGRYFADIAHGNRIVEIQTRNFARLKDKLNAFLTEGYQITVVYPIARTKWLSWIDENGNISPLHKSPKKGTPWQAAVEFYNLRALLPHPNLTLCILLCDMEEYRNLDGWSRDKKRGSSRYERFPVCYGEEILLRTTADWQALLPPKLPDTFTRSDYQKQSKLGGMALSGALTLLTQMHVIEKCPAEGRRIVYRKVDLSLSDDSEQ